MTKSDDMILQKVHSSLNLKINTTAVKNQVPNLRSNLGEMKFGFRAHSTKRNVFVLETKSSELTMSRGTGCLTRY